MFSEHLSYWGPFGVAALALEHAANKAFEAARKCNVAASWCWKQQAKRGSK